MAITSTDKLIDLTRLGAFLTKLRNTFVAKVEGKDLSDNNLTDEMVVQIGKIETLIAEGGEPNKIDVVKVNGTEQTITNKAVDLAVATMSAQGSQLNVNGAGMQVQDADDYLKIVKNADGIQLSAFHINNNGTPASGITNLTIPDKDYVDNNGGKIDTIKVNGVAQTITNKEVNLRLPTYNGSKNANTQIWYSTLRATSDTTVTEISANSGEANYVLFDLFEQDPEQDGIANIKNWQLVSKEYTDSTFRTEAQVNAAITAALANITGVSFQLVTELPETGENGVFYLVPITGGKSKNLYEEFVWINKGTAEAPDFTFESLGPTSVDLTGYLKDVDITLATTEDIDGLFTTNSGE